MFCIPLWLQGDKDCWQQAMAATVQGRSYDITTTQESLNATGITSQKNLHSESNRFASPYILTRGLSQVSFMSLSSYLFSLVQSTLLDWMLANYPSVQRDHSTISVCDIRGQHKAIVARHRKISVARQGNQKAFVARHGHQDRRQSNCKSRIQGQLFLYYSPHMTWHISRVAMHHKL